MILKEILMKTAQAHPLRIKFDEFFEANQYLRAKTKKTQTIKYRKKPKNGRIH